MNIYHANEFVTVLPEGLKDKTVNIFSLTDEGPSELSVVIARDKPQKGEDLDAYAQRQLAMLQQRLSMFRVLRREPATLGGEPAVSVDYTWQSPEGKMFQRQVMVFVKATGGALLLTATSRDQLAPKWEAAFANMLTNFRLRT
jgi:hypothetical protein